MKEIKFRAWDKKEKKMRYVSELGFYPKTSKQGVCYIQSSSRLISVGDFELMQFTGLHDRDGKEIYDGDVMIHPDFAAGLKLPVTFKNGCYCLGGWDCIRTDLTKGEIVGNIHEIQNF